MSWMNPTAHVRPPRSIALVITVPKKAPPSLRVSATRWAAVSVPGAATWARHRAIRSLSPSPTSMAPAATWASAAGAVPNMAMNAGLALTMRPSLSAMTMPNGAMSNRVRRSFN
jgi:hypothetical protein